MLGSFAQSILPAPVWEWLRLVKERAGLATFRPYTVRRMYGTSQLTVQIADDTARSWYDCDWQVPHEIELLASSGQLRKGAIVFDIGAHHAVVAMILARYVGDSGRIIAVEGSAHNVQTARANVKANALTTIAVVHAAGSDVEGLVRFMPAFNGQVATAHTPAITVPATTIDRLAETYGLPAVLFIDVEGYEINVLRGAQQTLRAARPDICVEVHAGGRGLEKFGTVDELLALIPADYEVVVSPAKALPFVALDRGRSILDHHSRLVALARSPAG